MKKITVEEHVNERNIDLFEERLNDMDEAGIDMQVLSFPFSGTPWLNASDPLSAAQEINNTLAQVVEKYPDRFAAFAGISLQDPDAATHELERAVKTLGLRGTMLWENMKVECLHDHKYWGIFEMAERLDVPVYLHTGGSTGGVVGELVGFTMGAGTSMDAMCLIFSGIFDKYPNLKIILGHMGEGIPYLLWRIDNQRLRLKGKKDPVPQNDWIYSELKKKPSEYFKDNFYVTTSGVFWQPALQLALSALGADRILFAVDYPAESAIEAVQFIESALISESDKEKICHLNSEKLLRL